MMQLFSIVNVLAPLLGRHRDRLILDYTAPVLYLPFFFFLPFLASIRFLLRYFSAAV